MLHYHQPQMDRLLLKILNPASISISSAGFWPTQHILPPFELAHEHALEGKDIVDVFPKRGRLSPQSTIEEEISSPSSSPGDSISMPKNSPTAIQRTL
ncbi:hypothetical protein PM082_023299 [Marasmius tenuissimus]|nr:hypothetical protein PM082_023299 [Marasmius tenuissimus]